TVLRDVSLEVQRGEVVSLLGANGAGKTTTLRVISGIVNPSSGRVMLDGRDITRVSPHLRVQLGVIHVPEGRQIFPRMTVLENLELGAYTKKAREKMSDTLERVYSLFPVLKQRRAQLAGTLSGGEQQMLAIARGMMGLPKLLLLDEPSLGLAPKIVMLMFDTIKKINDEEEITILLVEQNVYRSLQISDRAYILENGRITVEGLAGEVIGNPEVKRAYLGIAF
ncbi:MAG: ABC transporter ATP-binding protein, partial [Candidatus Caldarchaeum sp.]